MSSPFLGREQSMKKETAWGLYVAIATGLLLLGVAISLIVLSPKFQVVFEDFGVELPRVTVQVLKLRILLAQVFLCAGVVLIAGEFIEAWRDWRGAIRWAALGVACVGVLTVLLGFGLPLLKLMNELS